MRQPGEEKKKKKKADDHFFPAYYFILFRFFISKKKIFYVYSIQFVIRRELSGLNVMSSPIGVFFT